jgi:hypothetical protein
MDGCPTCSHTLARVGPVALSMAVAICDRCGTCVVSVRGDIGWEARDTYVPKLVGRCREYEKAFAEGTAFSRSWHTLGIRESINRPEDRK